MKNLLIFTILIISSYSLPAQINNNASLVFSKIEQLQNSGIKDVISISYESDESVILWDDLGVIKALRIFKSNSNKAKTKKLRLNRKQKENFEMSLVNYDLIGAIDNKHCAEARSFMLISIKAIVNGNYKPDYSFYSHCGTKEQRYNVKSLLSLYYDFL